MNLELEKNLEKADWEVEVQKQKIAEVEDSIKRVDDEKCLLIADSEKLSTKLDLVNQEVDEES